MPHGWGGADRSGRTASEDLVRDLVRSAQVVLAAGLVYGYALVLWLTNTPALNVTDADLQAYATRSGPGGALAVATLHGFWRTAPEDTVRGGWGRCWAWSSCCCWRRR